jgi:hypothetical protein
MMREKAKALGDIGTEFASKGRLYEWHKRRPLALELQKEQVGLSCDASFFRLARALSGQCSWASLGVVLFESNLSQKGHWRSQSGSRYTLSVASDCKRQLSKRHILADSY